MFICIVHVSGYECEYMASVVVYDIVQLKCWCGLRLKTVWNVALAWVVWRDTRWVFHESNRVVWAGDLVEKSQELLDLYDEFRVVVGEALELVLVQVHNEELVCGR